MVDGLSGCDYVFRMRLYNSRLEHITKKVVEYKADVKNVRFFKILGIKGDIMVRRGAEDYVVTWAGNNNGYAHFSHNMDMKQIITTAATMMTGLPTVFESDAEPTLF